MLLLNSINATEQQIHGAIIAAKTFPFKSTSHYLKLIRSSDKQDPVLKQIIPSSEELITMEGFGHDPVGDLDAIHTGGIIHKYPNRVLLITTQACAVHCRYCFRRNFPYKKQKLSRSQWQPLIDYLHQHPSVDEVILSGGDPLTLATGQLSKLITKITTVSHIKTIRFHTRIPVVKPERIDTKLIQWLSSIPLNVVMVIHCNHPNEIDTNVYKTLHNLKQTGITLLNQSVLLKGINDDVKVLTQLSRCLFDAGVLPYYLHTLDKAHGTGHFEVSRQKSIEIIKTLQKVLPGYLVPKVVSEIAGELSKVPLNY